MNKIKIWLIENYKACIIGIICVFLLLIVGFMYYQDKQKEKTLESMNIEFKEVKAIEYGNKDFDIQKELIKEVKNAKIKDIPEIDTMKVGEQTLNFVIVKDNLEKEVEYTINIEDTKAPEIKLKNNSIEIMVNDKFDIKSNIESVKDPVDGDISYNEDALEINKKATDEYNKLKKEDINENTKVADRLISDFLIEDIKDKEEKNLYLKDCYCIESDVDTTKNGKYSVKVIAVDKNGLKTTGEYKVVVNEKENKSVQNNRETSKGNTTTSGKTVSTSKGTIQDVMNTASAQVGKSYVAGGRGPNSFDCYGLVLFAFNQNGYGITDLYNAGYSVGKDVSKAQPGDIIITPHHVRLYLGNMRSAQAMNPSQGIRSGYDSQIAGYFQWRGGDPNFSEDPLKVIDIRRIR